MSSKKSKNIMYRVGVLATFGGLAWVAKHRAKKLAENVKTNLTSSEKIGFSVDTLVHALGTTSNIKNITSTLSSISVIVDDVSKVDEKELKKNGVQGVLKRANKLTIIFGDNAPAIKKVITDMTNLSDLIGIAGDQISEIKDKLLN